MTQNELNQAFVTSVLIAEEKGEQFPIDFDEVYRSAVYSRKDSAKRALLKQLIENEDYVIDSISERNRPTTVVPGSPDHAAASRREIIKLSCDGFDHFCMAANTDAGREARKMFIRYKKEYIANLNRQLQVTEVESLERSLEATRDALQNYPYTLERIWAISGIVNKSQVKQAIIRDFIEGRDYTWADDLLCVNESTAHILFMCFRSMKGTDVSQLPELIQVNTREYFKHHHKKKNIRTGQVDENQLSLFNL
jgi:phage anti-repressor protein